MGVAQESAEAWVAEASARGGKREGMMREVEKHALSVQPSVGMPVAHPLVHPVPRWSVSNVSNVSREPREADSGCWLAPCCCPRLREVHGPTTPSHPVSGNRDRTCVAKPRVSALAGLYRSPRSFTSHEMAIDKHPAFDFSVWRCADCRIWSTSEFLRAAVSSSRAREC